jgi:hypothetical protein
VSPKFLKLDSPEDGHERVLVIQNFNTNSMTAAYQPLATLQVDFLNSGGGKVGTGEWAIQPRCGKSSQNNFIELTGGTASSIASVHITGAGGSWMSDSVQCFRLRTLMARSS